MGLAARGCPWAWGMVSPWCFGMVSVCYHHHLQGGT